MFALPDRHEQTRRLAGTAADLAIAIAAGGEHLFRADAPHIRAFKEMARQAKNRRSGG